VSNGSNGGTARGFIEAMKSQPLALALAVIVILLLYFVYDVRQSEQRNAAEYHKQVAELLARCARSPTQ